MALSDKFDEFSKRVERIDNTMAVVVIVLLIGFASMFVAMLSLVINADGEKHASYQDLRDQVQAQNAAIKAQTDDINTLTAQLKKSTVTPNQ